MISIKKYLFNYIRIPQVKISNSNHAYRVGLSDAYMSQHTTNEHIIRVITLYHKINLDKDKIKNDVSIIFRMDNGMFFFNEFTTWMGYEAEKCLLSYG